MGELITSILLLQLLVLIQTGTAFVKRDSVEDKGSYELVCSQEPIDFGIVLDSSSSIDDEDFMKARDFLVDFLKQFDIGDEKNDVRVSIITYGLGIYPDDGFNLNTYSNKADLLAAIKQIPHRAGPYTDTGKAIRYMHFNQLSQLQVRSYAEKISLVITDGNSQNWPMTRKEAAKARADNITMFALGVGSEQQVGMKELVRIAGDESRVTRVDNFDSLEAVREMLAKKTCITKKKPATTTEAPQKTQSCGELDPADIQFIFSPSDLGLDAAAWTTSFISGTMDSKALAKGFRYGVKTGSCPDDEGFNLDEYDSIEDMKDYLAYYDEIKLPSLIDMELFSEEHGGRPKARDVAVIVVSGSGKEFKEARLLERIHELSANGVQVYVANPMGYPVEIPNTIALSGRSSRSQSLNLVNRLCPGMSAM